MKPTKSVISLYDLYSISKNFQQLYLKKNRQKLVHIFILQKNIKIIKAVKIIRKELTGKIIYLVLLNSFFMFLNVY